MSDWSIRVPYRSLDDPVGFVGFAARELEDADERAIVREMTPRGDRRRHRDSRGPGRLDRAPPT